MIGLKSESLYFIFFFLFHVYFCLILRVDCIFRRLNCFSQIKQKKINFLRGPHAPSDGLQVIMKIPYSLYLPIFNRKECICYLID